MTGTETYRWRKTTDINRAFALWELMDGETPILTDDGVFEVAFNSSIGGKLIEWAQLLTLINKGKALAEENR